MRHVHAGPHLWRARLEHAQFIGFALNAVDGKNRLSIPAAYREVIAQRSGEKAVLVGPHERLPCLIGYDRTRPAAMQALIDRRFGDDFGPERDDFTANVFGTIENLPYDDTGRVILSPILRDLGEFEGRAFFLGAGNWFEIWNPERLLEARASQTALCRIVQSHLKGVGK